MDIIYTTRKLFILIALLSPLVSCQKCPTLAYNHTAQPAPPYEHYGQQPNHPLPPPHHKQHDHNYPPPPPHHKQHSYQPHPPPPQPHEYFE